MGSYGGDGIRRVGMGNAVLTLPQFYFSITLLFFLSRPWAPIDFVYL